MLLLALSANSYGQGLMKRLKDKASEVSVNAVGRGVEKKIDKAMSGGSGKSRDVVPETREKPQATGKDAGNSTDAGASRKEPKLIKSQSRFDFVPGSTILYQEDWSQDVVGEFPLKWFTRTTGEVVTLDGFEGKWLRMIPDGEYLSPQIALKENYTIEFDLIEVTPHRGYLPAAFTFDLYDNGKGRFVFNSQEYRIQDRLSFAITPRASNSHAALSTWDNGSRIFNESTASVPGYFEKRSTVVHLAMNIQGQRIRVWVDDNKVYDVPDAVPAGTTFNQMKFGVSSTNYTKEEAGFFVTNIKLAAGSADTRSKLLTEGKLVTTGILFDLGSDMIKAVSHPVLKEIADVLKESPSTKISIIGHTDNIGEAAVNLDLSRKRAIAVKTYLEKEFGIEGGRMNTEGKGAAQPVASNDTPEGRANNRRVEFIRESSK